ncbi:MAG: DEAD/DEAH box helicase family protein [Cuniculiplasma sp.]
MKVSFSRGTLIVNDPEERLPDYLTFDERIQSYSCQAFHYASLKRSFKNLEDVVFTESESLNLHHDEKLRSYQKKAIETWASNDYQGVVVLPTAAGKTHIGIEAISILSVSTIIIAPTIELIQQWRTKLEETFNIKVGQIGGGEKDLQAITVCTYDSAYLMAEDLGNKFKFLLVDEVHHLASERYQEIARMYASPYRLGLTATLERVDMLHEQLGDLMGGKVFEQGYEELTEFLSDYEIVRIAVELEQEEEEEYERNRNIFVSYLRKHRIALRGPWDFEKFILSSWNPEGREALLAWRTAREIAFNARIKTDTVRQILMKNRGKKTLIFAEDTVTAYLMSREFLIPCITYLTPGPERKKYMEMFREGSITVLATSRVLDEGIDVPDASIGIVLSGSGSTRQFRQRLGRLLRPSEGKKSVLYEIVSKGTSEYGTSRRRRKGVPSSTDDN